jgi:hypothetical protein
MRSALVILALVAATAIADARPGSSGSTGGGSHPSSTYRYPGSTTSNSKGENLGAGSVIAIILGIGIFVVVIAVLTGRRQRGSTIHVTNAPPKTLDFSALRSAVPDFSRFGFEDTVADLVRKELMHRSDADPASVFIGDIRPTNVTSTHITCSVEAKAHGAYSVGHWTFVRSDDNAWRIESYRDVSVGDGPQLASMGREVGNDLPTLTDEQAIVRFTQLREATPSTTWESFTARVRETYAKLNDAWNKQDLADVEGYVTPRLVEWLRFWYAEYKRQGLVNHHADAEVRHIGLAQVTREPNLDAVTVRVYAAGHDFTTKADSTTVVGGSQTTKREYTEYWTFVRAKGTASWLLTKIEQDELYIG